MNGIVRKVDDLGRIVIPKEIRKSLNIKNNDDIEIIIKENEVILKKYYRLKSLEDILNIYSSILERFLKSNFIITDKESVILCSKDINLKNNKISLDIQKLLEDRKTLLNNYNINLKITDTYEINYKYYFYPIIINCDIYGSIMIFDKDVISEKDILLIDVFIHLIKNKIE